MTFSKASALAQKSSINGGCYIVTEIDEDFCVYEQGEYYGAGFTESEIEQSWEGGDLLDSL